MILPHHPALHSIYADLLQKQGKLVETIRDLEAQTGAGITNTVPWETLAACSRQAGEKRKAIPCYRRLMELRPAPAYLLGWIDSLDDHKDYEEKASVLQDYFTRYPDQRLGYRGLESLVRLHRENGQIDRALAVARECAKIYRYHESLVGDILRAQKKYDEAIACYQKVVDDTNQPHNRAYFQERIAEVLVEQEKYAEAKQYLESQRSAALKRPIYAQILAKTGSLDAHVKALEAARAPTEENLAQLIRTYRDRKESEKALDACRRLVALSATEDNYRRLVDTVAAVEGKEKALAVREEMFEKVPSLQKDTWRLMELARAYGELKNFEKAAAIAERCIALEPHKAEHYHDGSRYYSWAGQHEKSLEYARKALDLGDERHQDYYTIELARAWFVLKKYDEASRILDAFFDQHRPYFGSGGDNLAVWVHKRKGDLDAFIAGLKEKAKAKPRDPYWRTLLGAVHEEIKDYAGAMQYFEEALAIEPNKDAYVQLMVASDKAGDPLKRIDVLLRYQRDCPQEDRDGVLQYWLLEAYLDAGKADEAIAAGNRSLEKRPGSADTRYHLGEAYRLKGEFDKAIEQFKKAADDPRFTDSSHQAVVETLEAKGQPKEALAYLNSVRGKVSEQRVRLWMEAAAARLGGGGAAPADAGGPATGSTMQKLGEFGATVNKVVFTNGIGWAATSKGAFRFDRALRQWVQFAVNGKYTDKPVESVKALADGSLVFTLDVDGVKTSFARDPDDPQWRPAEP